MRRSKTARMTTAVILILATGILLSLAGSYVVKRVRKPEPAPITFYSEVQQVRRAYAVDERVQMIVEDDGDVAVSCR